MAKIHIEIELTKEQIHILAQNPWVSLKEAKRMATEAVIALAETEVYRRAKKQRRGAA